jgi:hypothetical protein
MNVVPVIPLNEFKWEPTLRRLHVPWVTLHKYMDSLLNSFVIQGERHNITFILVDGSFGAGNVYGYVFKVDTTGTPDHLHDIELYYYMNDRHMP